MSCIRLKLPRVTKTWKSLTSTLGKLHKIRKSKAMKKPTKHLYPNNPTTKPSKRTSKLLAIRRLHYRKSATVRRVIFRFEKKSAPVYVDKLFIKPPYDFVEHSKPQVAHNPGVEKIAKLRNESVRKEHLAGTSKGEGGCDEPCTSDDMWESLALASPLTQGIDERAEEFIARFRGEMAAQEMLARNL